MQAQLLDSFYGIDRGLQASTEVRAEISELITRLEGHNPTAAPNQVSPALLGHDRGWCLALSSDSHSISISRQTCPERPG